ncbi:MAG: endosialidase [Clostridiales bacterium]|jgi:hypothetical protein|nr:endosialidase [Clostridiales bacterium]
MAVIEPKVPDQEVIRLEDDQTISFGSYAVKRKQKADGFEVNGNIYNVKTHNEITRLEKNSKLLFESVPGSAVRHFKASEVPAPPEVPVPPEVLVPVVSFELEGAGDTKVTLELEPSQEYRIFINGADVGSAKSNISGKVNFSVYLSADPQAIRIEKV